MRTWEEFGGRLRTCDSIFPLFCFDSQHRQIWPFSHALKTFFGSESRICPCPEDLQHASAGEQEQLIPLHVVVVSRC